MPKEMPAAAADALRLIADSYDIGADAARTCVIALARQAMRENFAIKEFIMAMGHACFVMQNGATVNVGDVDEDLEHILAAWDDIFNMTGDPARFTVTGEVVTNW